MFWQMFPFFEVFGIKISMMVVGLILALTTFIVTTYYLCKNNHQDFFKLFYQLPLWLILAYVLGRYVSFILESSSFFPSSLTEGIWILRPHNFDLHFIGILITILIFLFSFFSSIKRTENKKIWSDILFSAFCNTLIVLGIFFTLGDTFIGKPTNTIFAIRALHSESTLTKFDGVYPIGLLLSIWALAVSVIINLLKIFFKRNWLGLWGLIWLLIVINICFLFQSYPRYGVVNFLWTTLDIKQYLSFFVLLLWIFTIIRRNKKRFY